MRTKLERSFLITILVMIALIFVTIISVYAQQLFGSGKWAVKYVAPVCIIWLGIVFVHLGLIQFKEKQGILKSIGLFVLCIIACTGFVCYAIHLYKSPGVEIEIGG